LTEGKGRKKVRAGVKGERRERRALNDFLQGGPKFEVTPLF